MFKQDDMTHRETVLANMRRVLGEEDVPLLKAHLAK
jgi:hypothetical protein